MPRGFRRLSTLIASVFLALTLLAVFVPAAYADEPSVSNAADIAAKIVELKEAGDADASEVVISGLSDVSETKAYLDGLSEDEQRYAATLVSYENGTASYSIVIFASPQWQTEEELAAEPMLLADATFEETLQEAWENLNEIIYLGNFQISENAITREYIEAVGHTPEQFNVRTFWYQQSNDDGIITQIMPLYLTSDATIYQSMRSAYEAQVTAALNTIPCGATDLAKVYLLHNWVCSKTTYNYAAARYPGAFPEAYTAYGVEGTGTAVCQGYALALSDLLNRAGIENTTLFVATQNHGWNMVKIDGKWYHVDATWDDTYDNDDYEYFVKSDSAFITYSISDGVHLNWMSTDNYGWTSDMVARDTTYDNTSTYSDYYWKSVYNPTAGTDSAHKWDAGTVTLEPTCTATGTKTFTCTVCGVTKTETIAALGGEHSWGEWEVVNKPTNNKEGTKKRTCSRCGATEQTLIDPLGMNMYRLYNPYTGEHLYTSDTNEYNTLTTYGWKQEGYAWTSPRSSSTPVYRLYNPYSSDHHYTTSLNEYNTLKTIGWKQEGVAWYSDDAKGVAVYRLFNPNETVGTHHYTISQNEYNTLGTIGWVKEGTAWYGCA